MLLHRGDWRAADCYGAADAFLVPFERARVAAGARRDPTGARRARCASTAPRSPRCYAYPGGLVVRVFRTAADAGPVTIEHEGVPARGWIVDLRGRPVAAFEGAVELRPFEIASLRLDA